MSGITGSGGAPIRPAIATTAAPVYIDSRLSPLSTDLAGNVRTLAIIAIQAATAGSGKSKLLTVTNLLAVAITIQGLACGVVTVLENSTNPLTDFYVMRPTSADDKETYSAGRSYSFTAPIGTQWQNGQTVGYIQNVSLGSATFIQDENA